MPGGHGRAERLTGDVDVAELDRILETGGEGEDAARAARLNAFLGPKRFGRMFPDAPPFRPPDEALVGLGEAMQELAPTDADRNSDVPAGYTYLGQFIDHDITFDQTDDWTRVIEDPAELEQARTPTLDLDSLYGLGPRHQSDPYDGGLPPGRAKFRIGLTSPIPSSGGHDRPPVAVSLPNDLPRRMDKSAVLADERNDENLVVAQTHLAFLKFHNRVMDTMPRRREDHDHSMQYVPGEEDRAPTAFHRARRAVRWHYQWLVLHDFLPRFVDGTVLRDVLENGRRFYDFSGSPFHGRPFMPVEFSVAAYRFGHSLVREVYNLNRVFAEASVEPAAIVPATLGLLFQFTGRGGFIDDHPTLPSNWIIDWRRFYDLGDLALVNFARKIDTKLAPQLHQLPGMPAGEPASLAVRNLLRGSRIGLPTGQDAAALIGETPLHPSEISGSDDGDVLRAHGFHERTPLWYYILKEAEVQGGGRKLGAVGSRIVAEVFVGLLEGDRHSYLSKDRGWRPNLPGATPGRFTMVDLLRTVNDINPIG